MQLAVSTVAARSGLTVAQVNKLALPDYQAIAATALRDLIEASDAIGMPQNWFMDEVAPATASD